MAPQQSPLQIVQGWALYPLVLQKKYKVTLQKTPHPPTHSYRLNYPSPALVHLSNPPDNQQTEYVLTQVKSLPVLRYDYSLRLQGSFFFLVLRAFVF